MGDSRGPFPPDGATRGCCGRHLLWVGENDADVGFPVFQDQIIGLEPVLDGEAVGDEPLHPHPAPKPWKP